MMQRWGQFVSSLVGYRTGVGGAVTQTPAKTSAVTLDKLCGAITMDGANLNTGAEITFTVNNAFVTANDVPIVCVKSGGTVGAYSVWVSAVAAGSFSITVSNVSGGILGETPVISFAIIKGAGS